MNKIILMGRLVKDPEVTKNKDLAIAKYTLAVDRKFKKDGESETDFINCVVFGKSAEFVEKYLKKGMKMLVTGKLKISNYEKDGNKIWKTEVLVEEQEFAESKKNSSDNSELRSTFPGGEITDADEEDLPF